MQIVRTLIDSALTLITSALNTACSYLNYCKLNLNHRSAKFICLNATLLNKLRQLVAGELETVYYKMRKLCHWPIACVIYSWQLEGDTWQLAVGNKACPVMKSVACAAGVDITSGRSGLPRTPSASFIGRDTCLTYCATCYVKCSAVKCPGHTAETVARVANTERHTNGKIPRSHNR